MLNLGGLVSWWSAVSAWAPFVSSVAKVSFEEHNLPYRGLSLREANISTIRTLRTAALQARDLTNPVPNNLVWEAANIHGWGLLRLVKIFLLQFFNPNKFSFFIDDFFFFLVLGPRLCMAILGHVNFIRFSILGPLSGDWKLFKS